MGTCLQVGNLITLKNISTSAQKILKNYYSNIRSTIDGKFSRKKENPFSGMVFMELSNFHPWILKMAYLELSSILVSNCYTFAWGM
jgi:hypothetical protein